VNDTGWKISDNVFDYLYKEYYELILKARRGEI
jgi:hypothetical protein